MNSSNQVTLLLPQEQRGMLTHRIQQQRNFISKHLTCETNDYYHYVFHIAFYILLNYLYSVTLFLIICYLAHSEKSVDNSNVI